jgi:murein DD-endopeptidase MepM/ murein hydrolase activator NlpD
MQLILVPSSLGKAKSVVLSTGDLVFGVLSVALVVFFAATALSVIEVRQIAHSADAAVQDSLASWSVRQLSARPRLPSAKLRSMATKVGHLQGQITVLDLQAKNVAALAGIKPGEFRFETQPGQGGLAPPASTGWLTIDEVQKLLDRLAVQIKTHADYLHVLDSRVVNYAAKKQLLPTILPIRNAPISSPFGMRTDPFTGLPAMHEGVDLAAVVGTPVMAAGGGIVIFAGHQHDFGNLVEIDHGNGIVTRYAHCSRLEVKEGEVVRRGQIIAAVGETGHATGPHLHFEVRYKGVAQRPIRFLRADQGKLRVLARSRGSNPGL